MSLCSKYRNDIPLLLHLIRLVDGFVELSPVRVRHVARYEEGDACSSGFHRTTYGFGNFRRDEAVSFRVFDVRLVLPILADEESAVDGLLSVDGVHLFLRDFAYP